MKTSTLKKSILDYATKGRLSSKFRESNPNLSATREIEAYNQNIQERRKAVNKELKTLDSKQDKEKIKKLKNELAKLKEIKILEDSAPFEIPKSWAWVKLGEVCEIQSGYTPKNNELNSQIGVPYFKVSDMNLPENQTYMLKTTLFSKNQKLKVYKSGSIIFPKNGGAVFTNKKRILTMDSIVDLNTSVLTPYFLIGLNYLYYFMLSIDLGKFTKGTALPTIDSASFNNTPIPLPPLKEQEKIVEVLDELISLASEFDRIKEELKRIEKRIEKSVLKLAIEGNLSKLYRESNPNLSATREIEAYNQNIQERRKAINKELKTLDSKQDKEKIKKLKNELAKLKEIKILEDSAPFEIPKSWAWVKLGEVCEIIKGTSYSQNDLTSSQGIRIMRGGNINKITHNLDLLNNDVYVNQKLFSSAKQVHKNDIIITSTNDIDNIAKCAFVNKDVDNAQIGAFLRIVRISESLNAKYVFFIFASAFYETYIQYCVSGTVSSLLNIRDEYINNLKIPLPPLKEQEKIVKILDKLFILKENLRVE